MSIAIRDLELECGFPLFEHRPNSIALTGQGWAFLREAERMIGAYSRLLFCVYRENPLAGQRSESLAQLADAPLVMLSDHYSQTKYLKRLFRAANYIPNVIQYTSQVFTILQHIRANAAAGFLSEDIAGREETIAKFAVREVEQASVTVIWRKNVQTFPAMDMFIRYIRAEKQVVLHKEKCGSFSEGRLYKSHQRNAKHNP